LDNKGVALDKLGNHTGAISYFDQSLDINPSDINALNYKHVILKNLGNHT
jgi:tetratricopeptide (TPR) repeat protein